MTTYAQSNVAIENAFLSYLNSLDANYWGATIRDNHGRRVHRHLVFGDGEFDTKGVRDRWVRLQMRHAAGVSGGLGDPLFRRIGLITITVYVRSKITAIDTLRAHVDLMLTFLQSADVGFELNNIGATDVPYDGGAFYQVNCTAGFRYETD